MKKQSDKKSPCSRGNKRGSIKVRSHKSKTGKTVLCYKRRKPVSQKKSHKKSHKK
jgi:hypothetical protein